MGGEYTSTAFRQHLLTCGITHQYSCPHTPEQNGVAERKHRHIIETTRTLLSAANLPLTFWLDAALTATYLINRMPTKTLLLKSPYELLYNTHPTYHHLRVFGSPCYPWHVPNRISKLHPNAPPCIFIGYSPQHKGYRCFNPATNKVHISRHVIFHEQLPPISSTSFTNPVTTNPQTSSHILPLLLPPIHPNTLSSTSTSPPPSSSTNTSSTSPLFHPSTSASPILPTPSSPPKPSTSTHQMTTRSMTGHSKPKQPFTLHHSLSTEFLPSTFSQANQHSHWRDTMQAEISALHHQQTWTLVSPPSDQLVLGNRWTFKIKCNSDGSIARYKARLVAQGFDQTYGLYYLETFSPVATQPTIRLFFTTALLRNWKIEQLDISNAFLHGNLHERVYMVQSRGFEDHSNPDAVCLLHKALYGLKQAPRQWHSALTTFLRSLGFSPSSADPSLFVQTSTSHSIFILIYVDDILITGDNHAALL